MERVKLTRQQARAMRLVRLGLAPDAPGAPALNTPHDVAVHHLAMQGQDFGAVQWAVASRLVHHKIRSDDVLAAFDSGDLVRTWPMRGTVHVLAAQDARWLLELCGPIALRGVKRRWENLGIDQEFVDTVRTVVNRELAGGRAASRDELVAAFVEAGLDFTEGQRRYHAIWYACQIGDSLLGPTRDGDNLLTLADDHVPHATRLSTEDALEVLARRYLAARGPASIEDLQHWTKLTKTQCRKSFAAIDTDLCAVDVEGYSGDQLYVLSHDLQHLSDWHFGETVPRVLTLAGFDEHLLGYRDRSIVLDPDKATFVDPGRNGVFRHTVVLDGQVVGTWKRRLLTKTTPIEVTLFEKVLPDQRRLIGDAFRAWGDYVAREPVVTLSA